jgi:hypothetical protein
MKDKLFRELVSVEEEMIQIRRHLHQYPEESFKEEKTPAYIAAYHRTLGHDVRTGVGGGGVVATLRGVQPGKTIALRADFDALPVQEETGLPYASKHPGVMHACGHDGHTASLLGIGESAEPVTVGDTGNGRLHSSTCGGDRPGRCAFDDRRRMPRGGRPCLRIPSLGTVSPRSDTYRAGKYDGSF